MPKFKVEVMWQHTVSDYATVEVEAKNEEQAKKKALKIAEANEDDDGKEVDWNDGEVIDGEYVTGEIKKV